MALYIFTGSGISAESGIPTFRDSGGMWENFKISDVCDYSTWYQNKEQVHAFYNAMRSRLPTVSPNHAHEMIAKWSKEYNATVFTQNVDDLLERAGCKNIIHLHGDLQEMLCTKCGKVTHIGYKEWSPEMQMEHHEHCNRQRDNRMVKPNVVFFGEQAPEYMKLYDVINNLKKDDIFIIMGTSFQVVPIDVYIKDWHGIKLLCDIKDNSHVDDWTEKFIGPAGIEVDRIDGYLKNIIKQ